MGNCVGGKGSKKDPTVLTEEEVKLLLGNTKLNRAQINALHQNFLKECPSGKLTKKDFVKLFKEVHPSDNKKEKADKFCEYVFKVIDREGLGYISFHDFVLCFSLTSYGDFKQKCEFAFLLYDLDKDGKISKKEMTQVLEALYDLSGITDRKGDKAPAKKVEDIMKKLNPADAVQPEAPKKEAKKEAKKDSKPASPAKEKKEKPAKEPKPAKVKVPEFITKEQFIDACSTDESIKTLFVDSIFAGPTTDQPKAGIDVHLPSVNVKGPSLSSNVTLPTAPVAFQAPGISIKSKTVIDVHDTVEPKGINVKLPEVHADVKGPHIEAPSVSVNVPDVKLPEVSVKGPEVKLPDVSVKGPEVKLPDVSVKGPEIKAPEVNVKVPDVKVPEVHAEVSGPEVKVKGPEVNVNAAEINKLASDIGNTIGNLSAQITAPEVNVHAEPISVAPLKVEAPELKVAVGEQKKSGETHKSELVVEPASVEFKTS